jgi:hypothetical protein
MMDSRLVGSKDERMRRWLLTPEEKHEGSAYKCKSDERAHWHFHTVSQLARRVARKRRFRERAPREDRD